MIYLKKLKSWLSKMKTEILINELEKEVIKTFNENVDKGIYQIPKTQNILFVYEFLGMKIPYWIK